MPLKRIIRLFLSRNRLIVMLIAAALICAGALICFCLYSAISYSQESSIKSGMTQALSEIASGINADLNQKYAFTKSLSTDNAVIRAVNYGIDDQLVTYSADKLHQYGLTRLIITDIGGKTIFDNSASGSYSVKYKISASEYISSYFDLGLDVQFYFPLINDDGNLCGSVSSESSVNDYDNMITSALKGQDFVVFAAYKGNILKLYQDRKDIKPDGDLMYTYFRDITTVDGKIISDKTGQGTIKNEEYCIGIGLPSSVYAGYRVKWIWISALISAAVLIVLGLAAFFIVNRYRQNMEIKKLRLQRHDFIKHIDIVNTLAGNHDTEELSKYINSLSEEISMSDSLSRLKNNAVAALLLSREKEALKKNIRFELDVKASLENVSIKNADLCVLLANLLDNAIEAADKASGEGRYIEAEISKERFYSIRVINGGEAIKEKNIDRIFEYGYTTKADDKNHGMGLYTVSQIVQKYDGFIKVRNLREEIMFEVNLPA